MLIPTATRLAALAAIASGALIGFSAPASSEPLSCANNPVLGCLSDIPTLEAPPTSPTSIPGPRLGPPPSQQPAIPGCTSAAGCRTPNEITPPPPPPPVEIPRPPPPPPVEIPPPPPPPPVEIP